LVHGGIFEATVLALSREKKKLAKKFYSDPDPNLPDLQW
jgi:hypothetical protein